MFSSKNILVHSLLLVMAGSLHVGDLSPLHAFGAAPADGGEISAECNVKDNTEQVRPDCAAGRGRQQAELTPPPPNRSDPCLVHYTFDEVSGGTVSDHGSYGHHGTTAGDVQHLDELDGRRGVVRFDGNSYIRIGDPDPLNFAGDMSFEMWVRLNADVENRWASIFGEWPVRNWYFALAHWHTIMLHYRDGYHNYVVPVQRQLLDDQWAHVAVVVEYPRTRFYRNGELIRDQYMAVPGMPNRGNAPKFLGGNEKSGIPIDLDEFRFYRRALTAAEIEAHARGKECRPRRTESLDAEINWYADTITLRLTGKCHNYRGHTVTFSLGDESSEQISPMAEPFSDCGRYTAEASYSLAPHENESIAAVARVKAGDGEVIAELEKSVTLSKPDWVDNQEGYWGAVPPPWTAVETHEQDGAIRVDVWGRGQVFSSKTPLASSMVTQGEELLAAPVSLSGVADGEPLAWRDGLVTLSRAEATAATVHQTFDDERAELRVTAAVEYDGYMTIHCALEAKREINLDELTLDIPLRSGHAKLGYGDRVLPADPEIPIAEWFSGVIEEDLSFKFGPTIFIGDARLGLLWQSESDEDWRNEDRQRAIEILPRGQKTFFRHHFVDTQTNLKAGDRLCYKFALQALPIKPLQRDAWDLRIARHEPWGLAHTLPDRTIDGMPAIDYLRRVGVRRLFTRRSDLWPWPMPLRDAFKRDLHRLTEAAHAGGLKLHQYVIHQRVPVLVPPFDPHGRRMAKFPVRQYLQGASGNPKRPGAVATGPDAPPQGAVFMCPKSMALQDAYIQSLADRARTFDEDGIYLDGTVHCPPCENRLHGCGYHDQTGQLRKTYPVFAVRRFMQRIYTVIKQEDPDHIIDNHCSWGYNPAALAYGDTLWTGEQWWHLRHGGADYIAGELSLDQFLTEFTGWQAGVAAETLHYRLGSNMKVAAISLLHDIPVRPSVQPGADEESYWKRIIKVWDARDRFGAQQAEKLYYFANQSYVQASPEKIYTTLLKHPENGVLALISNLHRDTRRARVRFDLGKLDLESTGIAATNAITQESLPLADDGTLALELDSHQWLYVWLRAADD